MKKINFIDLQEPVIDAENLNQLQTNVEDVFEGNEPAGDMIVESIKSKNMFNKNSIILNKALNSSGAEITASGYFVSDYMEVEANKPYTSQGFNSNFKAWYTSDKTFISSSSTATATSPSNAKYCRMNGEIASSTNMQLEKGSTATSYSDYQGYGYTSGSNANGSWVKYDDGRLEVSMVKTGILPSIGYLWGNNIYMAGIIAYDYPMPFIEPPCVTKTLTNNGGNVTMWIGADTADTPSATSTGKTGVLTVNAKTNVAFRLCIEAKGRWK